MEENWSVENWSVIDYDKHGPYMVSSLGRVAHVDADGVLKVLKPCIDSHGYLFVRLSLKNQPASVSVHRLVAQAFIPNPANLPEVNHKDGIKFHNFCDNLEWMSHADNVAHACSTGLIRAKVKLPEKAKPRGVSYSSNHKRWRGYKTVNGKRQIRYFKNEHDALVWRNEEAAC